jgi:glucose/arabinose dehydrogenase
MRWAWVLLAGSTAIGCGGSAPPPPGVNAPPGGETINGGERIGWDQPAADAVELATFRYAIYVDGARSELTAVSCTPSTGPARFACTARLPSLTSGAHAIQIASFVVDGSTLESARSASLNVTVAASTATAPAPPAPSAALADVRPRDGARLRVDTLVEHAGEAVDLAFAPDGRLFIAERSGQVRIARNGRVAAEPAISMERTLGSDGRLLALTLDPQFARTHFVYVLFTSRSEAGRLVFSVARLREAADTLGDRIVVLGDVPASASPAGALRFGPDGKLYAAFDNGGDPRRAGDPASLNGKVVRINPDGTTPQDQPGGTPVFAADLVAPTALAWNAASRTLWIADRRSDGAAQLRAVAANASASYALPADAVPTGIAAPAAGGSDLVVASEGGAGLLRVRIDAETGRPTGTDRLLQDGAGAVRALTVSADGAIVFATSNAIVRLVATGSAR